MFKGKLFRDVGIFLTFLLFGLICPVQAENSPQLFKEKPSQARFRSFSAAKAKSPWVKAEKAVTVNSDAFQSGSFAVSFDGQSLKALRSNARKRNAVYTEYFANTTRGPLLDASNNIQGKFILSRAVDSNGEEAVSALFELKNGKTFNLQHLPDNSYVLEEIDHDAFPDCPVHDTEAFEDYSGDAAVAASDVNAEATTQIDVLVGYTPEALAYEGSEAAMLAKIDLAISNANEAYSNSGVSLTLNLAHVVALSDNESVTVGTDYGMSKDLTYLANQNDGKFDEVHTLRNTYGADMVSLMTAPGDFCGIAYRPYNSTLLSYDYYAFSVVAANCVSYHSFAHELGHNIGLNHDSANAGGTPFYTYAYGHRWTGSNLQQYRSVMAYAPGTRVAYFSNPNIDYMGAATGDAATANNALTLINNVSAVSDYRESLGSGSGGSEGGSGGGDSGGGEEGSGGGKSGGGEVTSPTYENMRLRLRKKNGRYVVRAKFLDEFSLPVSDIPVTIIRSRKQGTLETLVLNGVSDSNGKVVYRERARKGLTTYVVTADDSETKQVTQRNRRR